MTDSSNAGAGLVGREELERATADESYAIVDVREAHEYAGGHVPGAVNLPLSRFDPSLLPGGKQVLLVCKSGGRSATALQRALAAGLRNVRHFAPGTLGWINQGGDVER